MCVYPLTGQVNCMCVYMYLTDWAGRLYVCIPTDWAGKLYVCIICTSLTGQVDCVCVYLTDWASRLYVYVPH